MLDGIRQAVPGTKVLFAAGAPVEDSDSSDIAEAVRVARGADAVIMVLGEHRDMSAEARNRTSLDLPGVQLQLLQAIHATGRPLVVVLMNGRPLSIPWLDENVPAILETWYLGVQMGPAVADVLFGDYNPGGKLPVTFPRTVGQEPLYYNHKNTGRPPSEEERYTSKYIDVPWTPLYPVRTWTELHDVCLLGSAAERHAHRGCRLDHGAGRRQEHRPARWRRSGADVRA